MYHQLVLRCRTVDACERLAFKRCNQIKVDSCRVGVIGVWFECSLLCLLALFVVFGVVVA